VISGPSASPQASETLSAEDHAAAEPEAEVDPDPDTLHITEHELALMELLSSANLTPRSTKRFVNLYYLVRASIPKLELDEFVGTRDAPGSCLIHVFLLGILIAWPDAAEELFAELQAKPPHARIDAVLQQVEEALTAQQREGGPSPTRGLLELAHAMRVPSRTALFLEPARRIERFSFRRGSARRRTPEAPVRPAPRNGFAVQA
jgi:hypothetical protein